MTTPRISNRSRLTALLELFADALALAGTVLSWPPPPGPAERSAPATDR